MTEIEKAAYLKASSELEPDSLDRAIWIKAMSQTGGDEEKAKHEYMRLRVVDIMEQSLDERSSLNSTKRGNSKSLGRHSRLLIGVTVFVTCLFSALTAFTDASRYILGSVAAVGICSLGFRFLQRDDRPRFILCMIILLGSILSLLLGDTYSDTYRLVFFASGIVIALLHVRQTHLHLLRLAFRAFVLFAAAAIIYAGASDYLNYLEKEYKKSVRTELRQYFVERDTFSIKYLLPDDLRKEYERSNEDILVLLDLDKRCVARWISRQHSELSEQEVYQDFDFYAVKEFGTTALFEIGRQIKERYLYQEQKAIKALADEARWKVKVLLYIALGLVLLAGIVVLIEFLLRKFFSSGIDSGLKNQNLLLPSRIENLYWLGLAGILVIILLVVGGNREIGVNVIAKTLFGVGSACGAMMLVFVIVRSIQWIFLKNSDYLAVSLRYLSFLGVYAIFVALVFGIDSADRLLLNQANALSSSQPNRVRLPSESEKVGQVLGYYFEELHQHRTSPWEDLDIGFLFSAPPEAGEMRDAITQIKAIRAIYNDLDESEILAAASRVISEADLSVKEREVANSVFDATLKFYKDTAQVELEALDDVEGMINLLANSEWMVDDGFYKFKRPQDGDKYSILTKSFFDTQERIDKLRSDVRSSFEQLSNIGNK